MKMPNEPDEKPFSPGPARRTATGARRGPAIVTIGASVGGLAAVQSVLRGLPVSFPAAVVIVQHRGSETAGLLERILQRHSALPVQSAREGERARPGTVYVAPADAHLTLADDHTFHVLSGFRIRHVRSAADPLFTSAAKAYGPHVIAIVLTGGDGDGSDGARVVAAAGGVVIAQDPATAQADSMPRSVIATGAVSAVLRLEEMAAYIVRTCDSWASDAVSEAER